MSGPIVRTGTTPTYGDNWDKIFGGKKSKTAGSGTKVGSARKTGSSVAKAAGKAKSAVAKAAGKAKSGAAKAKAKSRKA